MRSLNILGGGQRLNVVNAKGIVLRWKAGVIYIRVIQICKSPKDGSTEVK